MTAVVVAEAVAIAILTVLVTGLLRTQARIVRALPSPTPGAVRDTAQVGQGASRSGPQVGSAAPPVSGQELDGQVGELDPQGSSVLAFLTSGCTSCGWWWSQFRAAGRAVVPGLVVVTPDPGTDSPHDIARLAGNELRVIMSSDAWEAYGVRAGSTFVVIDEGHIKAAGGASDWDSLVALVQGARLSERRAQ